MIFQRTQRWKEEEAKFFRERLMKLSWFLNFTHERRDVFFYDSARGLSDIHLSSSTATLCVIKDKKLSPDNAENEKDLTTEKDKTLNGQEETQQNDDEKVANKSVENGDGTLNESKVSEVVAASPTVVAENGDSNTSSSAKKSKKKKEKKEKKKENGDEKDKKTFSAVLRSLSFNRRDKQKSKAEDATSPSSSDAKSSTPASPPIVVNGTECEKVPEEAPEEVAAAEAPKEEVASPPAAAPVTEAAPKTPVEEKKVVEEVAAAPAPVQNGEAKAAESPVAEAPKEEEKKVEVAPEVEAPPKVKAEAAAAELPAEPVAAVEPVKEEVKKPEEVEAGEGTPPPLPSIPPPSKVMVFAESALSSGTDADSTSPTAIPVATSSPSVAQDSPAEVVVGQSVTVTDNIVPAQNPEVIAPPPVDAPKVDEAVPPVYEAQAPPSPLAQEVASPEVPATEATPVTETDSQAAPPVFEASSPPAPLAEEATAPVVPATETDSPAAPVASETPVPAPETPAVAAAEAPAETAASSEPSTEAPASEVAETIALIDKVNEAAAIPPPPVEDTPTSVQEELSVDASSPLPQNSLETLPSPPSSLTPTDDASLPPPPTEDAPKPTTEVPAVASDASPSEELPPPPPTAEVSAPAAAPDAKSESIPPSESVPAEGEKLNGHAEQQVKSDEAPVAETPAETLNGHSEEKKDIPESPVAPAEKAAPPAQTPPAADAVKVE
ncbi:hypothetical protein DMENIID0001_151660 [Sergentomyia squamirostris]